MTYIDIKAKYGERMLAMAVTDIVLAGLKALPAQLDERSVIGQDMKKLIEDINGGSWDEIRAVIKRSL